MSNECKLAGLIIGYRKELLLLIKEFKEIRAIERAKPVADFHVHSKLKEMERFIYGGINSWSAARTSYFYDRDQQIEAGRNNNSSITYLKEYA